MKAQTTLSGSFKFLIIIGLLLTGGFAFYTSLSDFYGVESLDHSSLQNNTALVELNEDLKAQSDNMAESNVGGFTIFEGGLSTIKVFLALPGLIVGFINSIFGILAIPIYIIAGITAILIYDNLKDFVAVVWSKIRP